MFFGQIIIEKSRILLFAALYIKCLQSIVNIRESYNKKYPNGITISLNETLRQIYEQDFQIKKSYVGPNFRSVTSELYYPFRIICICILRYFQLGKVFFFFFFF